MSDINEILKERGERYGKFSGHADISQQLKDVISIGAGFYHMNPSQREAMSMICHKMARIANGDPSYADSWRDVAGYAMLIARQLEGENP